MFASAAQRGICLLLLDGLSSADGAGRAAPGGAHYAWPRHQLSAERAGSLVPTLGAGGRAGRSLDPLARVRLRAS